MKRGVTVFLVLSTFVSACSDGSDAAAPALTTAEPTTTTIGATPTTTSAPTTTTQVTTTEATTTAAPTTTQPPATTTAPTTTQPPATTTAPTTTQPPATTTAPTRSQGTEDAWSNPSAVDRCGFFDSQPAAQEWFEAHPDSGEGVDTNGDGSACDFGDPGGLDWRCGVVALLGHQPCPVLSDWPPTGVTVYQQPTRQSADHDLCRLADQRGLLPGVYSEPIQLGVDYGTRGVNLEEGIVHLSPMYAMGFPMPEGMVPHSGVLEVAYLAVDYPDAIRSDGQLDHLLEVAEKSRIWFEKTSGGRLQINFHFADQVFRIPQDSASFGLQARGHTADELVQLLIDVVDPVFDFTGVHDLWVLNPPSIAEATSQGGAAGSIANDFHKPPFPGRPIEGGINSQGIQTDEVFLTAWWGNGSYHYREDADLWASNVHETLHDMGIPDNYLLTDRVAEGTPIFDSSESTIPMSSFSIMSNQDGGSQTLIAWYRWLLGWLDETQVYCMPSEQLTQVEVSLIPLERTEDGIKSVMIPVNERKVIVVESRRAVGYDSDLGDLAVGVTASDGKERRGYLEQFGTSGIIVYVYDTGEFQHNGPADLQVPVGRPAEFRHISEKFSVVNNQWGWNTSPDDPWLRWDPEDPESVLIEAFYDPILRLGDSVTVEGVTVELVEWGDYDRVRISK